MKTLADQLCLVCEQPQMVWDFAQLALDDDHELVYTIVECTCGVIVRDVSIYTYA